MTPIYRFVNDDVAPTLTLVKTVTNDNGGKAKPTAWTLTATTPDGPNLSGTTGDAAVTAQAVQAGVVYTIGETGPRGLHVGESDVHRSPEHHASVTDADAHAGR